MEIGYTVWEWGLETENDLKTALNDLKELGYHNFENFIGMADLYEGREEEFNRLVKDYGLKFIALYNYMTNESLWRICSMISVILFVVNCTDNISVSA